MEFLVDRYDNSGKFRNAIAVDHRVKVIDYCRILLTKIDHELMEEKPSELEMRQHSNTIMAALATAFHNEGKIT